jgi:hypothetical protein
LVQFRHKTITEARVMYQRHRGAIRAALQQSPVGPRVTRPESPP